MEKRTEYRQKRWKSVQNLPEILWKSGKYGILISEKLQNVMVKR